MKQPNYFDYAATTPVDPRVAAKMVHYLTEEGVFGNSASTHVFGQTAKAAVDVARTQVANLVGAEASEIIWTSGATEANNLAIKGAAQLYKAKGKHIVTLKTEHSSVLECCQYLEKNGFFVTYLSPEKNGLLDLDKFIQALRDDTILVSIMHVNNEIGIIQDISTIASVTSARGILLHVDAAQSAGKIAINLQQMPVDLLSLSAHKVYGPKGIGALYVRRKPRVRVAAQIHGGGHEHGMRSGTLPTHQIVGMGEAFFIAQQEMAQEYSRLAELRQLFYSEFSRQKFNNDLQHGAPHILNIALQGFTAEEILERLPEHAVSSGSACHAGQKGPSYVLRALGQSAEEAASAIRISLGRFTTELQVKSLIRSIQNLL